MNLFSEVRKLYTKYEEAIKYVFFGFLGFLVSVGSYALARVWFEVTVSNVISWVIAVLFVYITNKFFVFNSRGLTGLALLREFIEFVGARVFTLLVETGVILFCANIIMINDVAGKIIAQVVIIILNYILSKFWIFKKKPRRNTD